MSYTGQIIVINNYKYPASVTIYHKSGLIGDQILSTINPIPRNEPFTLDGEFKSVQNYPVSDQFHIRARWNPGDNKYVSAETTIKYSWNKNDNGKKVVITLGETGVTFKPPSDTSNTITQNYDNPIQ